MGRHSAPRRHGHVVIVGAVALVGSAGIAWAVGDDGTQPPRTPVRSQAPTEESEPVGTAPTPVATGSTPPVVLVVPSPNPAPTGEGAVAPASPTSNPAPTAEPTRTKPGKGGPPTPRPTRSKK